MSISILPSATTDVKHSTVLADRKVIDARLLIETIRTQVCTIPWRQVPLVKMQMQNLFISDFVIRHVYQLESLPKIGRQDILY